MSQLSYPYHTAFLVGMLRDFRTLSVCRSVCRSVTEFSCVCFFSDELVVLSSFIILNPSSFFQGFDEVLVSSKDRITAGDGEKNDALEGKAVISTETTSSIFEFLKDVAGEKSSAHYSTILAFNLTLTAGPLVHPC